MTGQRRARDFYHAVGTPTVKSLKAMLKTNIIQNCPVTSEDINIAKRIFGPSISSLKGKATRTKPKVIKKDLVQIPKEILERNHDLTSMF